MQGRVEPLRFDDRGNTIVTFVTKERKNAECMVERLIDKPVEAKFTKVSKKRSLDQNAYMWSLLGALAEELQTDKDSIYEEMLRRYGQYITVKVSKEQTESLTKNYTADIIDSQWDQEWYYANIYIGSSQYDTTQMKVLLDGVISECEDLGIEVLSPEDLALLKEN